MLDVVVSGRVCSVDVMYGRNSKEERMILVAGNMLILSCGKSRGSARVGKSEDVIQEGV